LKFHYFSFIFCALDTFWVSMLQRLLTSSPEGGGGIFSGSSHNFRQQGRSIS
jgi:hypothetical protein